MGSILQPNSLLITRHFVIRPRETRQVCHLNKTLIRPRRKFDFASDFLTARGGVRRVCFDFSEPRQLGVVTTFYYATCTPTPIKCPLTFHVFFLHVRRPIWRRTREAAAPAAESPCSPTRSPRHLRTSISSSIIRSSRPRDSDRRTSSRSPRTIWSCCRSDGCSKPSSLGLPRQRTETLFSYY